MNKTLMADETVAALIVERTRLYETIQHINTLLGSEEEYLNESHEPLRELVPMALGELGEAGAVNIVRWAAKRNVYLARASVNTELARLVNLQKSKVERIRKGLYRIAAFEGGT